MRIVIVEDEAPIREGMGKILRKIDKKYELVGKAKDGEEGLKLIRDVLPDLIIMDIRMPKMDGLTMLSKLREQGITCKVVVLSAYSDFGYAKKAIELGIDNYLLKPVRVVELKRALEQVEEDIDRENSDDSAYSLNSIFLGAITGQFKADRQLGSEITCKYGIAMEEEIVLFLIYMEEGYDTYCDTISSLLEDVSVHTDGFKMHLLELPARRTTIMVIYHMQDKEKLYMHFQKSVVPMLCGQVKKSIICTWKVCAGLASMQRALLESGEDMEWNLLFGKGTLISTEEIGKTRVVPLKYPIQTVAQAKQAVTNRNRKEFENSFRKFLGYIVEEPHNPKDMKEACVRFCMDVIELVRGYVTMDESMLAPSSLQEITKAVSFKQIDMAVENIADELFVQEETDDNVSMLVQKAQQLILQYYNQGITLDEISRKLRVSEEYLSTQFKKETGKTFSETIRKCRIEKVKELLLNSTLKLNQIADMAGYSDPKYMSKVFKEEMGMLPAEYRKMNS